MDWETTFKILPYLFKGVRTTIYLSVIVILISTPLGLLIALAKNAQQRVIAFPMAALSWIIRGIPPLILLFFSFFAVPQFGVRLSAFQAAVIGLILYTTFYYAEAIRTGLASIQTGQYLAARSLGLSNFHTLRRIIIPQAVVSMLPPYISFTMDTIKGTSIASAISVAELMGNAHRMIASTFLPVEILLVVALIYGIINQLLVVAQNYVERRFVWR